MQNMSEKQESRIISQLEKIWLKRHKDFLNQLYFLVSFVFIEKLEYSSYKMAKILFF